MNPARFKSIILGVAFQVAAALILANHIRAAAGGVLTCFTSSECTIGEFLYDDNSNPVIGASCKINSKYPDGSLFLNDQALTDGGSGWYYIKINSLTKTGFYPTTICCEVDTDKLCIDKSFEVKTGWITSSPTNSEIASAVWNYSSRTLTNLGTIVDNILSKVSNLSDSWDLFNTRIQSFTASVEKTEKTVVENRQLLEKILNKPVIETSFEIVDDSDLMGRIEDTKSIAFHIYTDNQLLFSKAKLILSKWRSMSNEEILDGLEEMLVLVNDGQNELTLLNSISKLSSLWGWKEVENIYNQTKSVEESIRITKQTIAISGKDKAYREFRSLISYLEANQRLIGDLGNPNPKTLYGKIFLVESLAKKIDKKLEETDALLAEAKKGHDNALLDKVKKLVNSVIVLNQIPQAKASFFNKVSKTEEDWKSLVNTLLKTKALLQANRKFLISAEKKIFSFYWLEEGSLVIRILVSNPSDLVSQEVPVKFYLPPEIKSDSDILSLEDGLSLVFDTERNQYFIQGLFNLKPGESKSLSVRVSDKWKIEKSRIDSLRKEAEELFKPLEKTSYFAQGVTLKTDITKSLDKVELILGEAITPEQKIKAYREAEIEMKTAEEKIEKLKELVNLASGAGSFLGFVGGAQVMTLWGIIIVVIAGFVFLSLSLRSVLKNQGKEKSSLGKEDKIKKESQVGRNQFIKLSFWQFVIFVLGLGVISFLTSLAVYLFAPSIKPTIKGNDSKSEVKPQSVLGEKDNEDKNLARGGVEVLKIREGQENTYLFEAPEDGARVLEKLSPFQEVVKVDDKIENGWIRVVLFKSFSPYRFVEGWVKEDDVVHNKKEDLEEENIWVRIIETPTGWLRVREKVNGREIGKVNVGEEFILVGQENGWYQIKYNDLTGWISSKYAEVITE